MNQATASRTGPEWFEPLGSDITIPGQEPGEVIKNEALIADFKAISPSLRTFYFHGETMNSPPARARLYRLLSPLGKMGVEGALLTRSTIAPSLHHLKTLLMNRNGALPSVLLQEQKVNGIIAANHQPQRVVLVFDENGTIKEVGRCYGEPDIWPKGSIFLTFRTLY